jgi:hypothetical protein
VAVEPSGVITGFCFSAASTADQQMAETFFALRARPNPRLLSVGSAFFSGPYVTDKGFEGAENHQSGGSITTTGRGSSAHPSATLVVRYGPSA